MDNNSTPEQRPPSSGGEHPELATSVLAQEDEARQLQAHVAMSAAPVKSGQAPPGYLPRMNSPYGQQATPGIVPSPGGGPGLQAARQEPLAQPHSGAEVPFVQPRPDSASPEQPSETRRGLTTEDVVSRIGIGLLILGCGYLFKHSVEHGWIGPAARVAIGASIGALLLVTGLMLHGKRERDAAMLMGGSIAAFHVTLYGAHRLYSLLDGGDAVWLVFLVNLLALGLAVRFGHVALSVVGALAAFGAPFMLDIGSDQSTFLAAYLAAILVVNGVIALWKHWQSLLLVTSVGMWTGISLLAEQGVVVVGPVVALTALAWALLGWTSMYLHKDRCQVSAMVNLLYPPFFALVLSASASDEVIGCVMLGGASVVVALAVLRRARGPAVGFSVQALAFSSCAVLAAILILPTNWIVTGFALIPALLAGGWVMVKDSDLRAISVAEAGLLSIGFAILMFAQVTRDLFPLIASALALLLLIGTAVLTGHKNRSLLLLILHGLGMLWCFGTLEPIGAGVVCAAWAAIGIAELLAGTVARHDSLRNLGGATILVAPTSILFFDTINVPQSWRVLLFMGIGAVFLGVGWLLPRLTTGTSDDGSGEQPN